MSERVDDVVVVGGRCAGAATALLLARRGHRVTVLERGRLPGDTLSTHGIARGGVVQLARWGLLDAVMATGAPAVRQVVFRTGDHETVRTIKARAGVDLLVAPRRYALDAVLADAAAAAGATVRTGVTATGLLRADDGRVTGVRARTARGEPMRLPARVVVGADGVRSRIAGLAGAPVVESHPADSASFYVYVAGLPWRGFEYHAGASAFAGVFPTNAGEACVWVCCPAAAVQGLRGGDVPGFLRLLAGDVPGFLRLLAGVSPTLAARVRGGRVTSNVRGAVRLPNHLRRAAGPGWALVGDAGYHRDPITGHGITDAFRDADLLARVIHEHLRGNAADLSGYERLRDACVREVFDITCAMSRYPGPDEFAALQRRLSLALETEAEFLAALGDAVPAVRADIPVAA